MRSAFFRTLQALAEDDPSIVLLVGDLGFGVANDFRAACPGQFLNAGVAEQNMTGLATGLALSGHTVFTYSIGNFPTIRCLEQLRNDACYHNANVKAVCVGGGLAYGALGASHHATEDLAILRALPNMVVVAPGDAIEADRATWAIVEHQGPCYLRLGRDGEGDVHHPSVDFALGRAIRVREGDDLTLVATGAMLRTAVQVADLLAADGLVADVLSLHTLQPFDAEAVVASARRTGRVVTVEEHRVTGGLGSATAEALCDAGLSGLRFRRLGLPDRFLTEVGSQDWLLERNGLSAEGIRQSIRDL